MIEDFAKMIPPELLNQSGSVFYSGRDAFSKESNLYILGINPGGDPIDQAKETLSWHTNKVLHEKPSDWSAYRDDSWLGASPGSWGMQPRVLHLLKNIDTHPGSVPASNIVFQRSCRESSINGNMRDLAEICWPFHRAVIEKTNPRAILCFGKTAGKFVCEKIGANRQVDEFIEKNNRHWRSQTFINIHGIKVVVATHPSIANWCATSTDPSILVKRALEE